jgi:hypothetical protein
MVTPGDRFQVFIQNIETCASGSPITPRRKVYVFIIEDTELEKTHEAKERFSAIHEFWKNLVPQILPNTLTFKCPSKFEMNEARRREDLRHFIEQLLNCTNEKVTVLGVRRSVPLTCVTRVCRAFAVRYFFLLH